MQSHCCLFYNCWCFLINQMHVCIHAHKQNLLRYTVGNWLVSPHPYYYRCNSMLGAAPYMSYQSFTLSMTQRLPVHKERAARLPSVAPKPPAMLRTTMLPIFPAKLLIFSSVLTCLSSVVLACFDVAADGRPPAHARSH